MAVALWRALSAACGGLAANSPPTGIFSNDPRLPTPSDNDEAGITEGGYDYGVFDIANLIANALHGKNIELLTSKQQKAIYRNAEFDISDHMPIWMRLKLPE